MPMIGVAVTVPDPHGSTLQRCRAGFGDPQAMAIPTHVTLMPPTQIEPPDVSAMHDHLTKIAAAVDPFVMVLRGTGTFRPVSPVVFVQVSRGVGECEQLEAAVRSGPVARELQFPYHPHVTIAHHLDEAALDRAFEDLGEFHAAFDVRGIDVYEHGADGVWRPRRTFDLGR